MVDFEAAQRFLSAIVELSIEHGLSLSHEDEHGSFRVMPLHPVYIDWLLEARVEV